MSDSANEPAADAWDILVVDTSVAVAVAVVDDDDDDDDYMD